MWLITRDDLGKSIAKIQASELFIDRRSEEQSTAAHELRQASAWPSLLPSDDDENGVAIVGAGLQGWENLEKDERGCVPAECAIDGVACNGGTPEEALAHLRFTSPRQADSEGSYPGGDFRWTRPRMGKVARLSSGRLMSSDPQPR